jgi:chromosome partitioning protein
VTLAHDSTPPRIIAVANQKGGVGKTTTAINLSAALALRGQRVLILDLDPQGNASTGLGIAQADRTQSMYDVLVSGASITDCILPTNATGLSIVPANADLASADLELSKRSNRTGALKAALFAAADSMPYDFILIDCPPTLNLLTLNALTSCQTVLIPLQAEFYALEGLSQLMLTVREVRQGANPGLRLEGIVITMFDGRNRLAQQVEDDVRKTMGDLVFATRIPRNVRLSEAPSFAMSILSYDPASRGSIAYQSLAGEILAKYARAPQQ